MKEIREDMFGVKPEIGDTIVFNPVRYKGLVACKCIGFAKSGLPELEIDNNKYMGQINNNGNVTPKTGFVVYKIK